MLVTLEATEAAQHRIIRLLRLFSGEQLPVSGGCFSYFIIAKLEGIFAM